MSERGLGPVSARLAAVAAALVSGASYAHHSPSAFDIARQVVIEGTLTKVDWANPHIYLTVETSDPNGQRMMQQVESVSISSAQSTGLEREALVIGSTVVVRAHPNRRGSGYTVLGADITTSDGSTYALGATGRATRPPAATVRATGLAGSWAPKAGLFIPIVSSWPLTDKARAALAAIAGGTTITMGCASLPPPMLTMLPQLRTIELRDDLVVMSVDADGSDATRVIRLDLTEHPTNVTPTLLGHSIGKWEGATLVIDTIGFTPHALGVGFGGPGGAGKHLRERLTLSEDALQLRYELTLQDPEYLAAPATYTAMWDHRPDLEPSSSPCDPEIAERFRAE